MIMDYFKYLKLAGVPQDLHRQAVASFEKAKRQSKGLIWIKLKGRIFLAKEIAKAIPWEGERLLDYKPEWKQYDVAPMININANGDNNPWVETPEGGRPQPGRFLNKNPNSLEYVVATKSNYWKKDTHPRSEEARVAWYRRNAGEFSAYERGESVSFDVKPIIYKGEGVTVYNSGPAWMILVKKRLIGKLVWETRLGFEIDNLWSETANAQAWYPIPGAQLKAPVTNSSIPQWSD